MAGMLISVLFFLKKLNYHFGRFSLLNYKITYFILVEIYEEHFFTQLLDILLTIFTLHI